MRALISQLSQKLLPDLIQIEYTHFAGFRDSAPGVPALLVEHDLTFSLYRQLAETNPSAASWKEYERWLAFERKWLASYEGVWTVSEDDRIRAMEEGRRDPADRTFAIANGVDLNRFRPSALRRKDSRRSFMSAPSAICRTLSGLKGSVTKSCRAFGRRRRKPVCAWSPDRTMNISGNNSDERKICTALDPRIMIHGFVEDLRPLYERANVVAVPLEVSAGTNIKVLEAMACGKAIVSTPAGCAGLNLRDGYDIAIRKEWGEFSDMLCALFSDHARQPRYTSPLDCRALLRLDRNRRTRL